MSVSDFFQKNGGALAVILAGATLTGGIAKFMIFAHDVDDLKARLSAAETTLHAQEVRLAADEAKPPLKGDPGPPGPKGDTGPKGETPRLSTGKGASLVDECRGMIANKDQLDGKYITLGPTKSVLPITLKSGIVIGNEVKIITTIGDKAYIATCDINREDGDVPTLRFQD